MKKLFLFFGLFTFALLGGCAQTMQVSRAAPVEYRGQKTASDGPSIIDQLQAAAPFARQDIVFMVGDCSDKTGKFLDGEQLRYSRAVTQACGDLAANYLRAAGFKVAERDPFNMNLISNEYRASHEFAVQSPDAAGAPSAPKNIGLIQRGGPDGGLTGANYLFTGSISMYASSSRTGGGGADIDGIGFSVRSASARVGVTTRFVNVSTGLIESSLSLDTSVTGTTTSFHITRFIGDVMSSVATVGGGTALATALRPESNTHVLSGELGGAMQFPIDYAVTDALVASIARQLEANQALFYTKAVRFDYSGPTK
jgi:curli biogenesis system outer membrane secretion channel CsgG